MENKKSFVRFGILIGSGVLLFWLLENYKVVLAGLGWVFQLASPLLIGFCIAFVLGVPLKFFEKHLFPKSNKKWVNNIRRPICIVLSLVIIILIICLVLGLVVPELISAFEILAKSVPVFVEDVQDFLLKYTDSIPQLEAWIAEFNIPWNEVGKTLFDMVKNGASGIIGSTFNVITTIFSSTVNLFIAVIFALYILLGKEKLKSQARRICIAYFPEEKVNSASETLRMITDTFVKFITGQCTEAVILGTLCWLGLSLFQFPYAPMIGACIGLTALIPVVGAFIGGFVGGFMIFMVNPIQTIWFVVFILVLQQLENSLIYPRVVGTSVGLPAMWVLAAVTLGGGLFGVIGMLFAVPTFSVIYTLVRQNVTKRITIKQLALQAEQDKK